MNNTDKIIVILLIIVGSFVISSFVADSLIRKYHKEETTLTTTSDVEARRFIARCAGGVLIQEKDGEFVIRCGK